VAVALKAFGGMLPAADDRLLPERAAAHSENAWLHYGTLRGIPQLQLIKALNASTTAVFRLPLGAIDAAHITDSFWMEFEDSFTEVVRALVADDTFERYYWSAPSHAPRYNTRTRIENGDDHWILGIPSNDAPTIVCSGGTGSDVTRTYLTTWVTEYGEEGPASDVVVQTGKEDDTWTLTITAVDPADDGGVGDDRNITHTRIYRTVTSDTGVAEYFYVTEIPVATLSYADTATDDEVAANEILQSTNWVAPLDDLEGFVTMPNGIVAGFRENEVWFSEPYRPHAWPAPYSLVVEYPIVGLGVIGQTLVVCTQANPVLISGVHPSTMAQSKVASVESCLSRGSILSTADGVYYASPNGLILLNGSGIVNTTKNLLNKEKWNELVSLTTLRTARLGTSYMGFGTALAGVFQEDTFQTDAFAQEDFAGSYSGFLIEPGDERVSFNLLSERVPVTNVTNDAWSGEVLFIKDGDLFRLGVEDSTTPRRVYKWRSKIFRAPKPINYGVMRIYWDVPWDAPDAEPDAPEGVLDVEFPELPDGTTYGVVRAYADDTLVWTRELLTSGEFMRLPSGFKAVHWQFEFETYVEISTVELAATAKDLKNA
jgi:hypothetical protein